MSTRRATRARVQTQQNSPQPSQHNTNADDEGDVSPRMLHKLTKEVSGIKDQMAAMQANLQFISEQLRNPPHTHHASPRSSRLPSRHHHDLSGDEEDLQRPFPRQSPHTRRQRRVPPHPKETRIDLPPFHGKDNVEAYLDWVAKVEQLFDSHVVEEERRVSLAVLSFQGHALNWWTTLVLQKQKKAFPRLNIGLISKRPSMLAMFLHTTKESLWINSKGSSKEPCLWRNIGKRWSCTSSRLE